MIKKVFAGSVLAGLLASSAFAGQPVTIQNSANTAAAGVTGTSLNVTCTSGCTGGSGSPSIVAGNVSNATSGVATTATNVPTVSYNYGFNGTTWDQLKSSTGVLDIGGPNASGSSSTGNPVLAGVLAGGNLITSLAAANQINASGGNSAGVAIVSVSNTTLPSYTGGQFGMLQMTPNGSLDAALTPTSNSSNANVPTATAAVGSNLIVKGTPGNLYSWVVTSGASAGYVMIFNATTLPADGAVTPADCRVIAANSTIGSGNYDIPERYSTGIVIGFSTSGCFNKTASATAYIRATFQ